MVDKVGNKKHGACFTDADVAYDALKVALDSEFGDAIKKSFKNKNSVMLDPCCGSGALTEATVRVMQELGIKDKDIAKKIHAVELQEQYVLEFVERIGAVLPGQKIRRPEHVSFLEYRTDPYEGILPDNIFKYET